MSHHKRPTTAEMQAATETAIRFYSPAELKVMLDQFAAVKGSIAGSGLTIDTARLAGRTTAGTGALEPISVAGSLTLAGGILTGTRVGTYRDVFFPSGCMAPTSVDGADPQTITIGDLVLDVYDFDPATEQHVQFSWMLPEVSDPNGGLLLKPVWTAASGSGGVVWEGKFVRLVDDDSLTTNLGNAATVADTLLAAEDLHVAPKISSSFGMTPIYKPFLNMQISRKPSDGSDTLAVDARLLGVWVQYLEVATEASAW